jgi:hypothetical protein
MILLLGNHCPILVTLVWQGYMPDASKCVFSPVCKVNFFLVILMYRIKHNPPTLHMYNVCVHIVLMCIAFMFGWNLIADLLSLPCYATSTKPVAVNCNVAA